MSAMRIITRTCRKRLLADQRGDVLVGFILIVGLMFGLFFAGVGFFLLLSWLQFAEMATQAGVRTAVVRDAARTGLPAAIPPADGALVGQSCSDDASDPCGSVGTFTCTGSNCNGAGFPHIVASMRQVFPVIQEDNISITYEDIRIRYPSIGFAGGPPMWLVTVEVINLPIPVIGAIVDLASRLVGGEAGANATLRPITASMTAEDLRTAGVN
jgi:Flp pilus assembly protein TadG